MDAPRKPSSFTIHRSFILNWMNRLASFLCGAALSLLAASAVAQQPELRARDGADLEVVDCLLPSAVRRLGSNLTYLAPRRLVQLVARDCEHRHGEYVAFDAAHYRDALTLWREQAETGDAEAQTQVGEFYEQGLGVTADYAEAARWYKKAADQGFARAQLNLAYLYEQGLGVEADRAMAANLYRRATGIKTDNLVFESEVVAARAESQRVIDNLAAQLETQNQRVETLQSQIALTNQRLKQRHADFDAVQADVHRLERELAQARASNGGGSQDQIQALQSQLTAQQEELKRRTQSLDQLRADNEQQRAQLNEQLQQAAQQNSEIQARLHEQTAEVESSRAELASAQQRLLETDQRVADLSANLQSERERVEAARAELTQRQQNADAGSAAEIQRLQTELAAREDQLAKQQQTIDSLRKESLNYQDQVAELRKSDTTPYVAMRSIGPRSAPAIEASKKFARDANLGKFHALVIGNSDYSQLEKLDTAAADAQAVADVLEKKYGFTVQTLLNATRRQILDALYQYTQQLHETDSLLIYYAGHGELEGRNSRGYWLPVDATRDNPSDWISDQDITRYVALFSARHVLVVADSCYSGAMTRNSPMRLTVKSPAMQEQLYSALAKLKSRTVLTSGGQQPVLSGGGGGHSLFARQLIDLLNGNDKVLDGTTLYNELFDRVSKIASDRFGMEQYPQYSQIADAGHGQGDFLFVPTS